MNGTKRVLAASVTAFAFFFVSAQPAQANPALGIAVEAAEVVVAGGLTLTALSATATVVATAAGFYLCVQYCPKITDALFNWIDAQTGTISGNWLEAPSPNAMPISDINQVFRWVQPSNKSLLWQIKCTKYTDSPDTYYNYSGNIATISANPGSFITWDSASGQATWLPEKYCQSMKGTTAELVSATVTIGGTPQTVLSWTAQGYPNLYWGTTSPTVFVTCRTAAGTVYQLAGSTTRSTVVLPACPGSDARLGLQVGTKTVTINSTAVTEGKLTDISGDLAGTDPTQSPAEAPTTWQECVPSGWNLLNPLAYAGTTVCIFKYMFIPSQANFAAVQTSVSTAWGSSNVGQFTSALVAVPAALGGLAPSGGGCAGPAITLPAPWSVTLHPWDACTAPMSTVAGTVKAVSTVVLIVSGALLVYSPIARAVGLPPVRLKGEDDS